VISTFKLYGYDYIEPTTIKVDPSNSDYRYIVFRNRGSDQTKYSITFSEDTECDILIVGGGGGGNGAGGNGGSGIIIIKYKDFKSPDEIVQWTYKSENTDVYNLGNVAIHKDFATSKLDVEGDITGTTKNFKIEHPLGYNKWLYHSSIEGPRYDNIYRGIKTIVDGEAIVDIDTECNETGGMTPGTFVALNRNPQLYLRNNKTFDKVKGEIVDGTIKIYCENTKDKIEVNWMVMAERQDDNIKQSLLTNNEGNLICEKKRLH